MLNRLYLNRGSPNKLGSPFGPNMDYVMLGGLLFGPPFPETRGASSAWCFISGNPWGLQRFGAQRCA